MFALKKILSTFLMPFPLFLIFILIGIFFWYRGDKRTSKKILLFSLMWITLFSYPPFSALLLKPLESTYPKFHLGTSNPHYIHVLGNSHTSNDNLPLSSQIGLVSLVRVTEGVSIYKSLPNMKLIFSGYGGDDPISNARKNAQVATLFGVDPKDIILLESPKDTNEEAIAVKKVIGSDPLILVTSASHMVRASALFRKNGITVIEAPTDFQIKGDSNSLWEFPSSGGLTRSEIAIHEYLGILWSKIRGLI